MSSSEEYVPISSAGKVKDPSLYQVIAVDWRGEENEKEASRTAIIEAKKWSCLEKKILWNLDLLFTPHHNVMEDEILFHSRRVLVEYFGETCLFDPSIKTFGVCLYTGTADFERQLVWSENIEHHYIELLEERKLSSSPYDLLWKRGYALEILAEYLHKLGSYLPDDIALFCSLDVSMLTSPAEVLYLLSKERFQHLELILKGCALPLRAYAREFGLGSQGDWDLKQARKVAGTPIIGLVNPSIDGWIDETVAMVNHVVAELENRLIRYRIVNESTLTEEWDGLETLVVIGDALSVSGKRKLQGYLASGGEIVLFGDKNIQNIEGKVFSKWIKEVKRKSE